MDSRKRLARKVEKLMGELIRTLDDLERVDPTTAATKVAFKILKQAWTRQNDE